MRTPTYSDNQKTVEKGEVKQSAFHVVKKQLVLLLTYLNHL